MGSIGGEGTGERGEQSKGEGFLAIEPPRVGKLDPYTEGTECIGGEGERCEQAWGAAEGPAWDDGGSGAWVS